MIRSEIPQAEGAERGAIGSMLLEPYRVISMAMNEFKLKPDAFYSPAHRALVEVMYEMASAERTQAIDILTVSNALKARDQLDRIGGDEYIEGLIDGTPTAQHASDYLHDVRSAHVRREICRVCDVVHDDAIRTEESGDEILSRVSECFAEIIEGISREPTTAESVDEMHDKIMARYTDEDPDFGMPAGLDYLDRSLEFMPGGMTILAGRPGAGKSSLEGQMVVNLAMRGYTCARVTIDMNRERCLQRDACRLAGISLPKLKKGHCGAKNLASFSEARDTLRDLPVYINESATEIRQLSSWARQMKMRFNIDLLTVDHAQLVCASHLARGAPTEYQEVSHVSKMCKKLAKELNIHVLLLSQFSREGDKASRPPKLSDLRGSGNLEQDATQVVFLWKWPGFPYNLCDFDEKHRRATVVEVAKNQDGEPGWKEHWFHCNYFKFEEAEEEYWGFSKEEVSSQKKEKDR